MFIITEDFMSNGHSVGTTGPRSITDVSVELLKRVAKGSKEVDDIEHFYLYDDDGERYYAGYWVGGDGSDEFQPLDCFGGPGAGCTEIKMRNAEGKYTVV